jgi:glycosyltransferase involved in cell wall biosynthesis
MMRIALHLHRLHERDGHGIQRYARELAAALPTAGVPVEMWTGREDPGAPTDPGVLQLPAPRRALHAAWLYLGVPRIERLTGPIDLVHELCPAFPVPTRAAFVLTVHDLLPIQRPEWYTPREVRSFKRSVSHTIRHGGELVVPSEVTRTDLLCADLDADPARVHLVPMAATPLQAGYTHPVIAGAVLAELDLIGRPFVVVLGEVRARKNIVVLLQALARHPDMPVVVVVGAPGPGSEPTYAAIHELGVSAQVRLAGRRSDGEVAALLDQSLALVHPALYEGFGLTPVEAMARGVPAVVSTAASLPEVVADAALLADPNEPDDWAEQLRRLSADPDLRSDLARRGRLRAAELSWAATAAGTAAVYETALARR